MTIFSFLETVPADSTTYDGNIFFWYKVQESNSDSLILVRVLRSFLFRELQGRILPVPIAHDNFALKKHRNNAPGFSFDYYER